MATADQILTAEQQGKEAPKSLLGRFMDWVKSNHAQQPSFGAELKAMAREAAKDINSTMHQVFFGQPVSPGEPGTPMVPTQAMVTKDLGTVEGYKSLLDDAASRGPVHGQQQDRGLER